MKRRSTRSLLIAQAMLASIAVSPDAAAQFEAEWAGNPIGLWYNPADPNQFEAEFIPGDPDWDITPGTIEIGGVTFQGIKYPFNSLPGITFDVAIEDAVLTVAPLLPIRVSNVEFGGNAGAGVTIEAGGSWGIVSGTVNGGIISVNTLGVDAVFTDLTVNGTTTYTGGGTIFMGDSVGSRITGGNVTAFSNTLDLQDYTLEGGGFVGNESMSLRIEADSTVRANTTTPMVIDPGPSNNILNNGLMEAVDGGTLRIQQTAIINTSGTINAGIDSQVLLQDVTLTGGDFTGVGEVRGIATVTLENNINNSTRYVVGNGTTTILDGDLNNNTLVEIDGGSFLFNNNTSLVGGGAYVLNDAGQGSTSTLAGVGGVLPQITNVDNTIRGGGTVGFMTLINQGQVVADQAGKPLTVLSNDVTNTSTFEADGAELNIRSGSFNNLGGNINAVNGIISVTNGGNVNAGSVNIDGGSTLHLSDGTVSDAIVNNSAGGVIETGQLGGLLDGIITNPGGGTIRIFDDSALVFTQQGTYNNAGTILFDGSGPFASFANTALQVDGIVTLTGGGTVDLGASGDGVILSRGGTLSTFINDDNTIHGSGHIGRNTTTIVNHALIDADTGTLFIDPGNGGIAGLLTNTDTMRASNGATLHLFNGTYNNGGGTIQALAGSTVNIDQGTHILGGTLQSAGGNINVIGNDVLFDGIGMEVDAQVNLSELARLRLIGAITNKQTFDLANGAQVLIDGTVTLDGGGTVHLGGPSARLTTFIDGTPDLLINLDNTISGTGQVLFLEIESSGTTAPGNSPGTLTTNNFTQTSAGTLQIELLGPDPGEFDVLNVQGVADLSGTLEVILLPGLEVDAGTTFDVVTAGVLTTDFHTLALPLGELDQPLIGVEQVGNTLRLTALDDISVPVPEPGSGLLLGLAALVAARRRRA